MTQLLLPAAYLGPVATRCLMPAQTSTGLKQTMNETYHPLRDNVNGIIAIWPGFYGQSGMEVALGGTMSLTASALSPVDNVRRQFLFGGSATGTVPNKGLLASDLLPITGYAAQELCIRSYTTSATGILFSSYRRSPKDKLDAAGSGLVDKTMSGTVGDVGGANSYPPIAILGMTRKPTIFIAGDSIAFGAYDTVTDAWGDLGVVARWLGKSFAYINGGISGAYFEADNTAANYTNRFALSQYCSHIVRQTGVNNLDGASGATASNAAALAATFAAKFSKPVIGCTVGPATKSSSDGWTTVANQVVNDNNAAINAFNDLVRAGVSGESGYIDIADALSSGRNSGKFAVGYDIGLASGASIAGDRLHPNAIGNDRVSRLLSVRPPELFIR